MKNDYTITDIATAAGLGVRTVRFYVQQGLLPPPRSLGRGASYDEEHLARLRRIAQLQGLGHSLIGIRKLLDSPGDLPPPPPAPVSGPPDHRPQLLTRHALIDGVEISYDAQRYSLSPRAVEVLQKLAARIFQPAR